MPRKRASKTAKTAEESKQSDVGLQTGNPETPSEAIVTTPIESVPESALAAKSDVTAFAEKHAPKREEGERSQNFGIAGDYEAGVRLIENRREQLMTLKFDQKPSNDVLAMLRDAGFRWHPRDELWNHLIQPESARQTRIEAEKLFDDIRQMIRSEKGLGEGQTRSV